MRIQISTYFDINSKHVNLNTILHYVHKTMQRIIKRAACSGTCAHVVYGGARVVGGGITCISQRAEQQRDITWLERSNRISFFLCSLAFFLVRSRSRIIAPQVACVVIDRYTESTCDDRVIAIYARAHRRREEMACPHRRQWINHYYVAVDRLL